MTAFELGKALGENGTVSRGVCQVKDGYLESVTEMTAIAPDGSVTVDGKNVKLDPKTPVSMNLWGFDPSFVGELKTRFVPFMQGLSSAPNPLKAEFLLPTVVGAVG